MRDGIIVAIDADLSAWRGPDTEVVDLAGGMLHAGFVDAHIHPIQGGLERLSCDLSEGASLDDYARIITDYARTNPPRGCDASRAWITGGGWAMSAFVGGTPSAAELDAIEPIRPVFLYNRDHHGAWANSAALALAGITAETPDPADGRIERLADGSPQGTLHEGAAALVAAVAPTPSPDDEYAALLEAQRYAHSLGITGWHDAIVGDYFGASDTALVYRRALAEGRLTVDVVGALWWDRARGVEQVAPVMAAQFHLLFGDEAAAAGAAAALEAATLAGEPAFAVRRVGTDVFTGVATTADLPPDATIEVPGSGARLSVAEWLYRSATPKSGYHHSHGAFWVRPPGGAPGRDGGIVSLRAVAPTLVSLLGLEPPPSMSHPPLAPLTAAP